MADPRPMPDGRYRFRAHPSPTRDSVRPAPIITIPNVPATSVVHAPAGKGTLLVRRTGNQTRGWVRRWT